MRVLVDTNVLFRLMQRSHPHHLAALGAVKSLQSRGAGLHIVPQVMYEFWVVATRPSSHNGLGLSADRAASHLAKLRGLFPLLPEHPLLPEEWLRLVADHEVMGKGAHDARLVVSARLSGLTHLLTFNVRDFTRFSDLSVLDPHHEASEV